MGMSTQLGTPLNKCPNPTMSKKRLGALGKGPSFAKKTIGQVKETCLLFVGKDSLLSLLKNVNILYINTRVYKK